MGKSTFTYAIYIKATPAKVWQALMDPKATRKYWFGTWQESGWKKGASWRLMIPDGRVGDSGKIAEIVPAERLVILWRNEFDKEMHDEGFSRATYSLEKQVDCVKLTILHEMDVASSKFIKAVSKGWPFILSSLKSLLETGESFVESRSWPELKERSTSVNLLKNPRFKKFIGDFTKVSKACDKLSMEEGRKLSTQLFLTKAVYEPIHSTRDCEITARDGHKIPLRIYTPSESKGLPLLVYFHGGGWSFGNVTESDPVCRKLANHVSAIVVSVEYRLAPEHPFPKPLNDCYEAFLWVAENASELGGNRANVVVCGESAGGNLAAAVALMARDKKGPAIASQWLIYPAIRSSLDDLAYKSCVDQYFLTKEAMKFFWGLYLKAPADHKKLYASLDQSENLSGLPPALIVTAEYDPLRPEAEEYAESLVKAGVPVISKCIPEVIHSFLTLPIYEEEQKVVWIQEMGKQLMALEGGKVKSYG